MAALSDLDDLLSAGLLTEFYAPALEFLTPPLRSLAHCWGLPEDLVEDALQDTFLRVVRHHQQFDVNKSSARTWLIMLGRQCLTDQSRRYLNNRTQSLYGPTGELIVEPLDPGLPSDPTKALALIETVLNSMTARDRAVVRLRLEGRSQKEVACRLGLNPGNVGVIYHKFRQRLVALLEA